MLHKKVAGKRPFSVLEGWEGYNKEAYFMLANRRAARMEEIADFRIKCVSSYHVVQAYQ